MRVKRARIGGWFQKARCGLSERHLWVPRSTCTQPSHQITVTLDSVESRFICFLGFPVGTSVRCPKVASTSVSCQSLCRVGSRRRLRQFYNVRGSRRTRRTTVKFRYHVFGSIRDPLSVPAVPPNHSGSSHEATYALQLWLDAGPGHKDRLITWAISLEYLNSLISRLMARLDARVL